MDEVTLSGSALGLTAVIATILIPVVSAIKKPTWSSKTSYLLSFAASVLAAFIGGVVDNDINTWKEAVAYLGTAVTTAQTVYMLFFRDTDVNDSLTDAGT